LNRLESQVQEAAPEKVHWSGKTERCVQLAADRLIDHGTSALILDLGRRVATQE
jgi:hypothetical protein